MNTIYFDIAIKTFPGYMGYRGNPPQTAEDYSNIEWMAEWNIPSWDEVQAKISELESFKYQEDRATAYPSISDQLDLLYHDIKNGALDSGNWIAAIEAVKTQYPKP